MIEILSVIIVILCIVIIYIYNKLNNLVNKKNIELATYKEKISYLDNTLQKVNSLEATLNKKQNELTDTKEESSKYKTSLNEQKEKNSEYKEEIRQLKIQNAEYNDEIKNNQATISQLKTQLEEQNKAMQEKLKLLQNGEEKLKVEFENLANKIFYNNSKKFTQQNQEGLGLILNPMKQQLTDFKKRIEDIYDKETKDRSALSAELNMLKELNQKMTTETSNLTNALKGDSKKQGKWGEMVLENVLESSGLREGHEYKREVSLRDNENQLFRPDVIVYLPDNRHIIIDAKTSLTAYSEYIASDDEIQKQNYLKNHIKSIKEHIKELSNKKYEELQNLNSLDFIFMFVPIESALLLALEHDVNLYDEAFKQKIILVSPTTLLVALRAVENIWRYERQAQNIAEVYKRAEELYKKFNGFVEDLKKIGSGLKTANDNYHEAFKKLSEGNGNLIKQVTILKKISNIKPKKEIDNTLVDTAMINSLEDNQGKGNG